jgi:hypothetical protein
MSFKEVLDVFDGLITTMATVVVAVFTVVLARVTGRQAQLTRQLAESTQIAAKAAQETAAITRELAGSTETAAIAARDGAATVPTLERAYLFVEIEPTGLKDITARLSRNPNEPPQAFMQSERNRIDQTRSALWFHLANHGKTPAIVKAIGFTLQYRADINGPALFVTEPLKTGPLAIAGGMISSGSFAQSIDRTPETIFKLHAQLGQSLMPEDIDRLRSGLFVLLFVGRVIYEDVFGGEHETRVCRRYDPESHRLTEYGGTEFNLRT